MEGDEGVDSREGAEPAAAADGEDSAAASREERRREHAERLEEIEAERLHAEESGDAEGEANVLRRIGDLQRAAGVDDAAREAYAKARQLYESCDNAEGAAGVLVTLGNMEARLRRFEAAARFFQQARGYFQRVGNPSKEADALLSEADALYACGKTVTAVQRIDAASTLFATIDDTLGQAHAAYRLGMIATKEAPESADEHLELATRLFGDHVGREAADSEAPLPATVTDSRRHPAFVMQRVCLRERQRLAGDGGRLPKRRTSGSSVRKARLAATAPATTGGMSLPTWIGAGLLIVLALAFLLPQWLGNTTLFAILAETFGDKVTVGMLVHLGVAAFGAVVAVVGAQQLGISAPVVLLAMAIGIGMIFHDVSRAVFSSLDPPRPSAAAAPSGETTLVEAQKVQEGRSQAAKLLLDARSALARGDVAAARSTLSESHALAGENNDTAGRLRALEEMLLLEAEHGTAAERLAVAERVYDIVRELDDARSRTLLEEIVTMAMQVGDQAKLRDAYGKLLQQYEKAGDTAGAVSTLLALAAIDRDAHHLERAYEWYSRAHSAFQSLRQSAGQIDTLLAMGEIDARLGRRRRAYGHYYHAFSIYREINDESGQAAMLLHMGSLDEASAKYEEAIAAFRQSQRMFKDLGDPAGEALAALRFAAAQFGHGNQRQARDGFRRSLELYSGLDDGGGQARAQLGLGQYWRRAGKADEAQRHFEAARDLYRQGNDARGELAALREIALMAHERGGDGAARENLAEIRRVTRSIADPGVRAGLLLSAGDLALNMQRHEDAESTYREALALYENIGDDSGQRAATERLSRVATSG